MPCRPCNGAGCNGGGSSGGAGMGVHLRRHPGRLAAALIATTLVLATAAVAWRGGCAPSLPCCLLAGGGVFERQPGPAVELVVAHYAGNLSFVPGLLSELGSGAPLTVYSKSAEPPPGAAGLG